MIQQPADSLFLIADMLMNHGLCNRYILITDLLDNIIMFTDNNRMCSRIFYIFQTVTVHLFPQIVDNLYQACIVCHGIQNIMELHIRFYNIHGIL